MAVAAQPMAARRERNVSAFTFVGQNIDCPVCSGSDLIQVGNRDRHGDPLATDLCRRCGHVFTNPQPTEADLNQFYSERYRSAYKGILTPKRKHIYRAGLRALERLDRLKPFLKPSSRLLDIGAGGGEFTYLMSKAGYAAQGVEPNKGYAEFAKAEYGIDVQVGTVSDIFAVEEKWDVITLHHVLEHLADPVVVLKNLADILSDDGVVVIEVPNVEARYHGPQRRFHFAHLHTFSKEGLDLAASFAGLTKKGTLLQPGTGHINSIYKKTTGTALSPDSAVARRIEHHLDIDTPLRDIFTSRPYRRLWANLKRPLREKAALTKLNAPESAKDILDRLFGRELER